MNEYKALMKQIFTLGNFSLVPIRIEDRYDIMKWRNEQIYHLRQSKPLNVENQDAYFKNVISKLFDVEQPDQILFSFLILFQHIQNHTHPVIPDEITQALVAKQSLELSVLAVEAFETKQSKLL